MKGSRFTVKKSYDIFNEAGKKIATVKARTAKAALEKVRITHPDAVRAE